MKSSRFYCDCIEGNSAELDKVESHHLLHVMRLSEGSTVELFDGKGGLAKGIVVEASRKRVRIDIQSSEKIEARTTGRVIIAAAVAKGNLFDLIIGKCTELGVDCIVPVIFDRTVKQAAGSSILDRYRKLSVDRKSVV